MKPFFSQDSNFLRVDIFYKYIKDYIKLDCQANQSKAKTVRWVTNEVVLSY